MRKDDGSHLDECRCAECLRRMGVEAEERHPAPPPDREGLAALIAKEIEYAVVMSPADMVVARRIIDRAVSNIMEAVAAALRPLAEQPLQAEEPLSSFRICLVCDDQWRVSLSTPLTRAEQSVCFKCWQKAKGPCSASVARRW